MAQAHDYVVVGGGSAGAALAARLSEDPKVRVLLLEAGERPPEREQIPAACASLQLDPETDWMFTADPGRGGRGLRDRRMMVPRGRMLGGSSGINYLAWVRGHPGDFDRWAELGAAGWSYEEVLPIFRRIEDFVPTNQIVVDGDAHGRGGPVGVTVRSPVLPSSLAFLGAAEAAGIPAGDYNGRTRGGPEGVSSLFQTNTRRGRRCSTYHAYLEGDAELRPNLDIVTHALARRIVLEEDDGGLEARGVEYQNAEGEITTAFARREVILCAGAVGSPHLLMLSGVGPRRELEDAGVPCRLDLPGVGKHLKDHLQTLMVFPAPGVGVSMLEVGLGLGPDALRAPAGPLPADPADDVRLEAPLKDLRDAAQARFDAWRESGSGLISSTLYDAVAFFSTGLGDPHSHDAQIGFFTTGYNPDLWRSALRTEPGDIFEDPDAALGPQSENIIILANPVLPRSEGEIVLESSDPARPPSIRMNYFSDPHDLKVMTAVMRKALDIVDAWPGPLKPGPWQVPPELARKHGHRPGDRPSDALLENMALHYALTVYHLSCTCRIGEVVDASLKVRGVRGLRVADASVMPDIISGNTNAASIMIGEKAADLIRRDA